MSSRPLVPSLAQAELPVYDRPLTIQLWYADYPGACGSQSVRAFVRGGTTEVSLEGQTTLYAAPVVNEGPFPLVIVSHGYPGNRFLLSHLAENLGLAFEWLRAGSRR